MSDSNDSLRDGEQADATVTSHAVSSNYKVLGYNTTGSGTTYGVLGQVDSPDGYGLFTPDDAKIKGVVDTAGTDFVVQADVANSDEAGNVVQGGSANEVKSGAVGATISGGGYSNSGSNPIHNVVADNYGTVGGGQWNIAGSTTNGDPSNSPYPTVGGGFENTASGEGSVCGGGFGNEATASFATVGGGSDNVAGETGGTVPGGKSCAATGQNAFAAGSKAKARDFSSFVWADWATDDSQILQPFASDTGLGPTGSNTFSVRATGGARIGTSVDSDGDVNAGVKVSAGSGSWSSLSARASKTDIEPVDPETVLDGVRALEISTWEYQSQPGVGHMGPMAGEFHDRFGLGPDADSITGVDADGVALAAIKGLSRELDETLADLDQTREELEEAREELDAARSDRQEMRAELAEKDDRIDALASVNDALADRLERVESRLDRLAQDESAPAAADD